MLSLLERPAVADSDPVVQEFGWQKLYSEVL